MGTEIPGDQHGSGDAPLQHIPAAMLPFSPAFFPALTKRKKGKEKKKKSVLAVSMTTPSPVLAPGGCPAAGLEQRGGEISHRACSAPGFLGNGSERLGMSRVWVPLLLRERPRHPLVPILAFCPLPRCVSGEVVLRFAALGLGVAIRDGVSLGTAGVSVRGEDLGAGTQ